MIFSHSKFLAARRGSKAVSVGTVALLMLPANFAFAQGAAAPTPTAPAPVVPANNTPAGPPSTPTAPAPLGPVGTAPSTNEPTPSTGAVAPPIINQSLPGAQSLAATAPAPTPIYVEPTGPILSITQAVGIALQSNQQVQNALTRLKRQQYNAQEVTGQAYPQIRLDASDTYSSEPSFGGEVVSAQTNLNTDGVSIPTITDAQSSGLFTSTTESATTTTSSSSANSTTTGTGSSTTSSSVTINPVQSTTGTSTSTQDRPSQATGERPLQGATTTPAPNAPVQTNTASLKHNNYGHSLSLSQLVDVFGLVGTAEAVLKEQVQFYRLETQRVADELAYTVKSSYFSVLRDEQELSTTREQVNDAQANLNDTEIRFNAGTVPAFDVVSAQTTLSNEQQALINAQITLEVDRADLNNILNRPLDTPFSTSIPAIPALPTDATDQAEVQVALARRPELQQADLTLKIAGDLVKLDRAGLLPSVALSASTTYQGRGGLFDSSEYNSSVSAAVSIPLYDGGQTRARTNEAKEDLATEQVNKSQLQIDISLEVRSAFVNVKNGAALVQADTQGVAEARESLRIANISYRAGTGTLLQVTNAEASLATAQTNLATAQFQLQSQYSALIRAEGGR